LRNWTVIQDPELIETYRQLSCNILAKERWFADRGASGALQLEASAQYRPVTAINDVLVTLNLYTLPGCPGFFYYLPLLLSRTSEPAGKIYLRNGVWCISDGIPTCAYLSLLRELMEESVNVAATPPGPGEFCFRTETGPDAFRFDLHGSSSNSLLIVTERCLVKNFRRVFPGRNPELNLGLAFTKLVSTYVPRIYGYFSYHRGIREEFTLGVVEEYIENRGNGWEVWEGLPKEERPDPEGKFHRQACSLGKVLAGIHRELALIGRENGSYVSFSKTMVAARIARLIATVKTEMSAAYPDYAAAVTARLQRLAGEMATERSYGAACPIHGDLHLQQVLATGNGWKVIDFEGEPLKTVAERETPDSPLKDLASMMRSISYRVYTLDITEPDSWEQMLQKGLFTGYLAAYQEMNADFLPHTAGLGKMLLLFQLERVLYEFVYESKYRPAWLKIPLKGLESLLR
jgi:trehalose synthase-fused probable maltokinase